MQGPVSRAQLLLAHGSSFISDDLSLGFIATNSNNTNLSMIQDLVDIQHPQHTGKCYTVERQTVAKRTYIVNCLNSGFFSAEQDEQLQILAHHNTPYCNSSKRLYAKGATFATSNHSLCNVYEDALRKIEDKAAFPSLHFNIPVFCVGGDRVFGHFLLQCLPKLVIAKALDVFEKYTFIFTNDIPRPYISLMKTLDLYPPRSIFVDQHALISSSKSVAIPISPILSTLSYSSLVLGGNSLDPSCNFVNGYGLSFPAYRRIHQAIKANMPDIPASLDHLSFRKVYIARKAGSHRDCVNRQELIPIAEKYGFLVICIEELLLTEQIILFNNCEFLITEVGSSACNGWLMPNLKVGLELCIDSVLGAWGLTLASTILDFKFYRINGSKIIGTQKRFDGDPTKEPLNTDFDYSIDKECFIQALQAMLDIGH